MLRVQPLEVVADGRDCYRVRCQSADGEVVYEFTMDGGEGESRHMSNYEDAFYFVTYDDPDQLYLGWSIMSFDRARYYGVPEVQHLNMKPTSMIADGEPSAGQFQYRVVFEGAGGTAEHMVTVTGNSNTRIATWQYGSLEGQHNGVSWVADETGSALLYAILLFDVSRRSKDQAGERSASKPKRS